MRPSPFPLARLGILVLLWGSTFLWIELSLEGFSAVQLTFGRCLLGSAVLLVVLRATGGHLPPRRLLGPISLAALLVNVAPFVLIATGQQSVDSGLAGILSATTPLWTALLAFLFGSDTRPTTVGVAGLILGFTGTAVIVRPWDGLQGATAIGIAAILAAALSYAIAFVYIGTKIVREAGSPVAVATVQLAVAATVTGLGALILREPMTFETGPTTSLAILGIFGTGVTLTLFVSLIADEGPTVASTVGYLLPVVAVVLGVVVLGESLRPSAFVGAAMTLAGVALVRTSSPTRPVDPEER